MSYILAQGVRIFLRAAWRRAIHAHMAKKSQAEKEAIDLATSIEQWPLRKLKPYKRNAKKHPPEQIQLLAAILRKHGFDQPIVVDAKGVIIKGHGRWLAARELGMETVPVIVRDLPPASAAEARIADNRSAEFGWDFDQLVADVVGNLPSGFDPDVTGWSLEQLGLAIDPSTGEIERTEVPQGEQPVAPDRPPSEFPKHDEDSAETQHLCPKCGFEF